MKFLPVLAVALFSTTAVFGQKLTQNHNEEANAINTGFGFKGGVNVSSLYGTKSGLKTEGITSFHIGSYGKLGLGEKVALQLEALYSRRGANTEFALLGNQQKTELRFDYIDVPLLFVYNILGEHRLSVMAGPQASLMLTAKTDGKEIDKEAYHTFDMSAAAGVQLGFDIFRAGVRYNYGFRDLINHPDAAAGNDPFANQNLKNHWGQVYVGLEF